MNRRDVLKGGLGALGVLANPFRALGIAPLEEAPERGQPECLEFVVDADGEKIWEICHRCLGTVNSDAFLGNAPKTVMLCGSNWARRNDGRWNLMLFFAYSAKGWGAEFDVLGGKPLYTKIPFKPLLKLGKRVA